MKIELSQWTDKLLLQSFAKDRSEEAFWELIRRYSGMVHSTCHRILGDSHLAQDAVQAVFIILSKKAHQLHSNVILSGWLYRTATFTALKHRDSNRGLESGLFEMKRRRN